MCQDCSHAETGRRGVDGLGRRSVSPRVGHTEGGDLGWADAAGGLPYWGYTD